MDETGPLWPYPLVSSSVFARLARIDLLFLDTAYPLYNEKFSTAVQLALLSALAQLHTASLDSPEQPNLRNIPSILAPYPLQYCYSSNLIITEQFICLGHIGKRSFVTML